MWRSLSGYISTLKLPSKTMWHQQLHNHGDVIPWITTRIPNWRIILDFHINSIMLIQKLEIHRKLDPYRWISVKFVTCTCIVRLIISAKFGSFRSGLGVLKTQVLHIDKVVTTSLLYVGRAEFRFLARSHHLHLLVGGLFTTQFGHYWMARIETKHRL